MSMDNSERSESLGVHVRPATKKALQRLASQRVNPDNSDLPMSVSRLVSDLLDDFVAMMGKEKAS
jgi:hypothetical protein